MTPMSSGRKPMIYLAGPITGCKDHQVHGWRDALIKGRSESYEFIDPTRRLKLQKHKSPEEYARLIVEGDRQDIMESDAVLAHLWKESIGTAMGIMAAYSYNKPVVVVLPESNESAALRQNHTIRFYARAIVKSLREGMEALDEIFAGATAWRFLHENRSFPEDLSETEILNRLKMISMSCGRDSISTPRRLLDRILVRIQALQRETITEKDLNDAAQAILEEEDPCMAVKMKEFLKSRRKKATLTPTPTAREVIVSGGDHQKSMWGDGQIRSLKDIPDKSGARALLRLVASVDGVEAIHLGAFDGDNCRPQNTHQLRVYSDNGQNVIFARIHGRGVYKHWQDCTITISGVDLTRFRQNLIQTLQMAGMLCS